MYKVFFILLVTATIATADPSAYVYFDVKNDGPSHTTWSHGYNKIPGCPSNVLQPLRSAMLPEDGHAASFRHDDISLQRLAGEGWSQALNVKLANTVITGEWDCMTWFTEAPSDFHCRVFFVASHTRAAFTFGVWFPGNACTDSVEYDHVTVRQ